MKSSKFTIFGGRPDAARAMRAAWAFAFDTALLAGLILALEATGTAAGADWQAFVAFACATAFGVLVVGGRKSSPLRDAAARFWSAMAAAAGRRFDLDMSFDFSGRGQEPRFRAASAACAASAAAALALGVLSPLFPGAVALLKTVSGAAWAIAVGLLWSFSLLLAIASLGAAAALAQAMASEGELAGNPRDRAKRRKKSAAIAFASGLAFAAAVSAFAGPAGTLTALIAAAVVNALLALAPRGATTPLALIRNRRSGTVRRTGLFELEHHAYAAVALIGALPMLASHGRAALPGFVPALMRDIVPGATAGGAGLVATIAAVCVFALVFTASVRSFRINLRWVRENPSAARIRTIAYLPGSFDDKTPANWRAIARKTAPHADSADLWYDASGAETTAGRAPALRRNLSSASPAERAFILDHFDYVTKRRAFYRGVKRLMKIAAGRKTAAGGGFLLAPHHFFIEGMHRDDSGPEAEPRAIGPSFRHLWNVRERRFIREVFSALGIDIIYFEDQVRWKHLKQALDQCFEFHMKTEQHRMLEERDFRFLAGVRVFIEELEPASPREKHQGYREPHFDNLARARVLAVFRDRGGDKSDSPDFSPDVKLPMTLYG